MPYPSSTQIHYWTATLCQRNYFNVLMRKEAHTRLSHTMEKHNTWTHSSTFCILPPSSDRIAYHKPRLLQLTWSDVKDSVERTSGVWLRGFNSLPEWNNFIAHFQCWSNGRKSHYTDLPQLTLTCHYHYLHDNKDQVPWA